MQKIFRDESPAGARLPWDWDALANQADLFECLETPHRWSEGCSELGRWTLSARRTLQNRGVLDLRRNLPPSVTVIEGENQARSHSQYQLRRGTPVYSFEEGADSLLILTRRNVIARSFRGLFNRRIPLWEGHQRPALETLVDAVIRSAGDVTAVADATAAFLQEVAIGLGDSAFGRRFRQEARERCAKSCRGKPAVIQELARFIVKEPDHRGVSRMLQRLADLRDAFDGAAVDHAVEYWDATRLGNFETADGGYTEITNRRAYSRPRPRPKAISTIHKAKGLQVESVILMPCDADTFPDRPDARCLLYVALSRATSRLMLVVSRDNPSPLLAP
jgi:DNA helicase-2/ATP-dependent DNA helicase PcrA